MGGGPLDSEHHEAGLAEPKEQARTDGTRALQTPSIWQHKPWWCQPWSIVSTGLGAVCFSWLLLHRWWISLPLTAGVLLWWWLFLVLVPAAYARGELDA
jgi:hypothetical protein